MVPILITNNLTMGFGEASFFIGHHRFDYNITNTFFSLLLLLFFILIFVNWALFDDDHHK